MLLHSDSIRAKYIFATQAYMQCVFICILQNCLQIVWTLQSAPLQNDFDIR